MPSLAAFFLLARFAMQVVPHFEKCLTVMLDSIGAMSTMVVKTRAYFGATNLPMFVVVRLSVEGSIFVWHYAKLT